MNDTATLIADIRACTVCRAHLPLGPKPVFQFHPGARILIVGQAPGRKVHETGLPFNDPSGDRLRDWLGISRREFYDAQRIALLPMGFCYPGSGPSGDLPPRPECARHWRAKLLERLEGLELTIVLGRYAQAYHFPQATGSLTALVRRWRECWPVKLALPHPSPRNNLWLKRNPWFEAELLAPLRLRVAEILAADRH